MRTEREDSRGTQPAETSGDARPGGLSEGSNSASAPTGPERNDSLREAREESGLREVSAVTDSPVSLEILAVQPHEKRGKFVPAHLHLNLTYLLEADPAQALRCKPDENSGVRWFSPWEALSATNEACMRPIYRKLIDRVALYY